VCVCGGGGGGGGEVSRRASTKPTRNFEREGGGEMAPFLMSSEPAPEHLMNYS
jgi:hypothetical protein